MNNLIEFAKLIFDGEPKAPYSIQMQFDDYNSIESLFEVLIHLVVYGMKLKNISILEIVIVASGYSFRIIYGAEIFNLPVSKWLMVFVFTFAFGITKLLTI
jgi:uncharacterized protein YebE (UPF0316 family)